MKSHLFRRIVMIAVVVFFNMISTSWVMAAGRGSSSVTTPCDSLTPFYTAKIQSWNTTTKQLTLGVHESGPDFPERTIYLEYSNDPIIYVYDASLSDFVESHDDSIWRRFMMLRFDGTQSNTDNDGDGTIDTVTITNPSAICTLPPR